MIKTLEKVVNDINNIKIKDKDNNDINDKDKR